ncbi:hypothetical protein DESPIG_01814 [Desulfovibrio piger ATCC 29098]|uniref:Uncharacterized protein n=1 Tax=Desulfovibrio piger ATCC 29098 TaxID=411464 RepID=B6WUQ3_9BACT|nr:hypothetical protein DESPIG_01814 [Desulfovibrio piger ATCC 29098]
MSVRGVMSIASPACAGRLCGGCARGQAGGKVFDRPQDTYRGIGSQAGAKKKPGKPG